MPAYTLPVSGKKWKELVRTEWTQISAALQDLGDLTAHYNRPDGTKARLYTLTGTTADLPTDAEPYAASQFFAVVAREIRARLPRAVIYRESFEYRADKLPDMAYSVQIAPGPRHADVASVGLFLNGLMRECETVEQADNVLFVYHADLTEREHIMVRIQYSASTIEPAVEEFEVVLRPGKPFNLPLFLYATLALW